VTDFTNHRWEYDGPPLRRRDLDADPIVQFRRWFGEWEGRGGVDPAAVVLSTSTESRPSARYVVLRGVTDEGRFLVFGNRASRKGRELEANPQAALCFGWLEQHRQVRVEGTVSWAPDDEVDAYFASRPHGSRIAAWVSERQSSPVRTRDELEARFAELEARYPDAVPRPPTWSGIYVQADVVEFWQGRLNRLHDRFTYTRSAAGWVIARLTP
jgi:pyridoxamine 5'-phosphate oxidase